MSDEMKRLRWLLYNATRYAESNPSKVRYMLAKAFQLSCKLAPPLDCEEPDLEVRAQEVIGHSKKLFEEGGDES